MTMLTVPLTAKLTTLVNNLVDRGIAPTKAALARKALEKLAEDIALADVLESEQEAREGKILRGDLKDLVAKL